MNNETRILEILKTMQSDINEIKNDIADLKEGQEIIRFSVNRLCQWADECSNVLELPLPKL